MKFYLLPIGETFTYQGITYTKSGPLTASSDVNGQNKMIPRSANIKAKAELEIANDRKLEKNNLSAKNIANVINAFYRAAGENLNMVKAELTEASYNKAKLQLDDSYKEALKVLSLN